MRWRVFSSSPAVGHANPSILQQDGSILQSTVSSQLPGRMRAKGLQLRLPNGRVRAVRLDKGRFWPPEGGWAADVCYDVVLQDEGGSPNASDVEDDDLATTLHQVATTYDETGSGVGLGLIW